MGKPSDAEDAIDWKIAADTAGLLQNLHSTGVGGLLALLMISRDICSWLPATEPLAV